MEGRNSKGRFVKGHKISENLKEINRKIQTGRKHSEATNKKQSISRHKWLTNPNNKKKFLESQKESAFKRRKWKISKEELYDLYWNKKLSIRQIAKKLNTSYGVVHSLFERENVPRRTDKEGMKLNPAKLTEKGRTSISENTRKNKKRAWQDQEYRKKMLIILKDARKNITEESLKKSFKSLSIKPNKPEKFIIRLIKQNNLPFKYVGDGKIWIGKRCPDFISTNGDKKIIELHGRAFHDPNSRRGKVVGIPYHRTKKGTIEHYKKHGYSCLVIWDDELKEPQKVLNKITTFS